jgi:MFS family permease
MLPVVAEVGATAPVTGRGWRAGDREFVGLVSFSHGLQHVYGAILPLTYPFVVVEFGIGYGVLGLVLAVSAATGGFLQAATGFLGRFSARALFGVQNLVTALLAVLAGLSPNFAVFAAARLAGSVATAPQHPIGSAVLSTNFPERRGTVLSIHTTAGSLGTLVVPLAASAVLAAYGWRTALFVFAVPLALGGLLLIWRLRDKAARSDTAPPPSWGLAMRSEVLKGWPLTLIAASALAAGGRGLGVVNAYVPAYLASGLHLRQIWVGAVFTVLLAGSVAGPLAVGWLSDRFNRALVAIASYVGGSAALAAFGLVGANLAALFVTGALVGVLAYAESPLLQSMFGDAVDAAVQRVAFAMYFAMAYGAGSIWVFVLGVVIDRAGFSAAYLVMAGSFLVAAALLAMGWVRRPPLRHEGEGEGSATHP